MNINKSPHPPLLRFTTGAGFRAVFFGAGDCMAEATSHLQPHVQVQFPWETRTRIRWTHAVPEYLKKYVVLHAVKKAADQVGSAPP